MLDIQEGKFYRDEENNVYEIQMYKKLSNFTFNGIAIQHCMIPKIIGNCKYYKKEYGIQGQSIFIHTNKMNKLVEEVDGRLYKINVLH